MNFHQDLAPRDAVAVAAPRMLAARLPQHIGERVLVCGWLTQVRQARGVRFLSVRDRSGTVQLVQHGTALDPIALESAVRVEGSVVATSNARYGAAELHVDTIEVVAPADEQLPDLRDAAVRSHYRHLDLRSAERLLVFETQTTFLAAAREFLVGGGFLEIHTPKITAGGSESGAAVFELPYFGSTACLVQSPQFYVQLAMAAGFDRVFEVGPAFRAEQSDSNRHATEFTSLDVELSWIDSHHEVMALEEDMLRYALREIDRVHGADIERVFGLAVEHLTTPIPRIPYREAVRIAGDAQGDNGRMTHRAEQALSKYCRERHGHSFVFVTDFPMDERSFYTMRDDGAGGSTTRSFDLLWRGLEITSGCQREHRHDRLRGQTAQAGIAPDVVGKYLDPFYFPMFRQGCPTHGGFGLGVNRFMMALLGQPSLRETSFVFRGPTQFRP
jgi:aspartyl-tRNA synthetase